MKNAILTTFLKSLLIVKIEDISYIGGAFIWTLQIFKSIQSKPSLIQSRPYPCEGEFSPASNKICGSFHPAPPRRGMLGDSKVKCMDCDGANFPNFCYARDGKSNFKAYDRESIH